MPVELPKIISVDDHVVEPSHVWQTWLPKEYREKGTMHGVPLPAGMRESERLPEPVFTPSTKAEQGHDENITVDEAAAIVGPDVIKRAHQVRDALHVSDAADAWIAALDHIALVGGRVREGGSRARVGGGCRGG